MCGEVWAARTTLDAHLGAWRGVGSERDTERASVAHLGTWRGVGSERDTRQASVAHLGAWRGVRGERDTERASVAHLGMWRGVGSEHNTRQASVAHLGAWRGKREAPMQGRGAFRDIIGSHTTTACPPASGGVSCSSRVVGTDEQRRSNEN